MMPTLSNGHDISVDTSIEQQQMQHGIYVLRRDDTLIDKRITVHPGDGPMEPGTFDELQ